MHEISRKQFKNIAYKLLGKKKRLSEEMRNDLIDIVKYLRLSGYDNIDSKLTILRNIIYFGTYKRDNILRAYFKHRGNNVDKASTYFQKNKLVRKVNRELKSLGFNFNLKSYTDYKRLKQSLKMSKPEETRVNTIQLEIHKYRGGLEVYNQINQTNIKLTKYLLKKLGFSRYSVDKYFRDHNIKNTSGRNCNYDIKLLKQEIKKFI